MDIFQYLSQFYFQILAGILIYTIILFFIQKKSRKTVKRINTILIYIILPIWSITWPIFFGYFRGIEDHVYKLGRVLGYATIWLLLLILYVKPLVMLRKKPKTRFAISIKQYLAFILGQRRTLGIATFYLVIAHILVYFSLWIKENIVSSMLGNPIIFTGILGFIALFVARLTSNNFSIKKLGKHRKHVQMISYFALIFSVIHIFLVNKETGLFFIGMTGLYFVLKVFEWTKILDKKKDLS